MSVRKTRDTMTGSLQKIQREFAALPREAYRVWLENTPKQSGNARRRTRLQGNQIRADYPYADKLDEGSSRQASDGMSQPTTEYLNRRINRIGK